MLTYVFLSGLHRTLPFGELRALVEGEGLPLSYTLLLDQVVLLDTSKRLFRVLEGRAVLSKYGGVVLSVSDVEEGVEGLIKVLKDSDICRLGGFSHVSFRRVKRYGEVLRYSDVVGEVVGRGEELCRRMDAPLLDIIITEGLVIAGLRMFERDLSRLRERDPQRRPVYRPGTMIPEWCRLFVNLSRASPIRNPVFIDPFAGVGGLLIEACDMGMKAAGSDLNPEFVSGASKNLRHYGCVDMVSVADACRMPFVRADAVATDMPYGRLTRSEGRGIKDLVECFLKEVASVIKPGGYVVFAQKADVEVEDLVRGAGLEVVERYINWVHGALTRDIFVVRKK
ncbi:MAG: hypothetical protein DRO10_03490 [Thermoprotei archaeon]|nr:MAG: hypothetical protein DRO10_03490 [Thermoprotei archaeon]